MKNYIEQLSDAFKNPSKLTEFGCELDSIELQINRCREINSQKSYCVIKNWCLWKLETSEGYSSVLSKTILIKSDYVIDDELKRFPVGGWVRSSPIIKVHQSCLFETGSTFYIAVGPGGSKFIDVDDALAFF
jgi:hypothetical protein